MPDVLLLTPPTASARSSSFTGAPATHGAAMKLRFNSPPPANLRNLPIVTLVAALLPVAAGIFLLTANSMVELTTSQMLLLLVLSAIPFVTLLPVAARLMPRWVLIPGPLPASGIPMLQQSIGDSWPPAGIARARTAGE
jgi:hypothetical protein